jgi:predicted ester cyclase
MVAEDDRVGIYQDVRMRHTGEFQGISGTGRLIEFAGSWFYRIVGDQIIEAWHIDQDFTDELRKDQRHEPASASR